MQIGDLLKHYETGQYYIIVDHLIDIEYDNTPNGKFSM